MDVDNNIVRLPYIEPSALYSHIAISLFSRNIQHTYSPGAIVISFGTSHFEAMLAKYPMNAHVAFLEGAQQIISVKYDVKCTLQEFMKHLQIPDNKVKLCNTLLAHDLHINIIGATSMQDARIFMIGLETKMKQLKMSFPDFIKSNHGADFNQLMNLGAIIEAERINILEESIRNSVIDDDTGAFVIPLLIGGEGNIPLLLENVKKIITAYGAPFTDAEYVVMYSKKPAHIEILCASLKGRHPMLGLQKIIHNNIDDETNASLKMNILNCNDTYIFARYELKLLSLVLHY